MKDPYGNQRFYGTYRASVYDNNDPIGKARLKLLIPQILGTQPSGWAWAVDFPEKGFDLPKVNDTVWVQFEGGDPSYPIWTGPLVATLNYGAFYDTTTQTISSTTTAYPIQLNTVDQSSNVTITSGSQITIANVGTYNLQWSGQFENTDTQNRDVRVWLRFNGVDYPQSASIMAIPASHGGISGHAIAAWNWVGTSQAPNDVVQIMWSSESTAISLAAYAAGTSPASPAVPSVIVTLTQVK